MTPKTSTGSHTTNAEKPFIVSLSGKGGVGKTTLTALILDELARKGFPGPVLAVDGDPAATLHFALGLPAPVATVADIRDDTPLDARTVRNLPTGVSPKDYVYRQLMDAHILMPYQLRQMPLHFMSMGRREGHGCYCAINKALSSVLGDIIDQYPLVIIDNEAGLEHLNRYRLARVDYFLTVATPAKAAMSVAQNILQTAQRVAMDIAASGILLNRADMSHSQSEIGSVIPDDRLLFDMEISGYPIVGLPDNHRLRQSLRVVVKHILDNANV